MADSDKSCPKCSRAMEIGFVADVGYGMILQSNWTAGIPVARRFIGGIKSFIVEELVIIPISG